MTYIKFVSSFAQILLNLYRICLKLSVDVQFTKKEKKEIKILPRYPPPSKVQTIGSPSRKYFKLRWEIIINPDVHTFFFYVYTLLYILNWGLDVIENPGGILM